MLPKAHSECTWTEKADGGLYHQYFYDVARHARTLEACREFCCRAAECKAIRFSPTAVDGPDLQCLLYPRGAEAWSLEQPLYKDYRVHLRGDGVIGQRSATGPAGQALVGDAQSGGCPRGAERRASQR
ncbi:unnamed protein product [Prorocentrum cordatum]|uniref:Apple domain-containing protein n=1 Tax=Prorocentrum cordatum TaxID=2364126 RepID=A0ABN9UGI3_9DINO|nr:unnamed protein product [Polarella glacialis]